MTTTTTTDPAALLAEVLAADDDDVDALLRQLWHNTPEDVQGQRAWLLALDDAIRAASDATMGELAILAGALIENGGPHDAFPPAIFERLGALLDQIPADEGADLVGADAENDDEEVVDDLAENDDDDDDDDDDALPEAWYQGERAVAALWSRSKSLRQTSPHKELLLGKIRRYSEVYGFLGKLLRVLDDEPVLVVHPATRRVWRVRIGGIADNFQLHLLLLARFATPALSLVGSSAHAVDGIVGDVPGAEAIAAGTDGDGDGRVVSHWQLACWGALKADGSLSGPGDVDGTDDWIWNEGMPAEIKAFEGVRVIVIGAGAIERSWYAQRIFSAMHGTLDVEGRLGDDEAAALIDRLVAAAEQQRAEKAVTPPTP